MLTDTLSGIRERHAQRWLLIFPAGIMGGILSWTIAGIASLMAMPWTWDEDGPGCAIAFAASFTFTTFAAIAAPSYKRAVALLFAAVLLSLMYAWLGSSPDPALNMPWDYWLGLLAGIGGALILVLLKCRPRWLLVVPAYWLGFLTLMVPSLFFLLMISAFWPELPSPPSFYSIAALYLMTSTGSFGAVAFPALISPGQPVRVASACLLANLAIGVDSLIQWLKYGDYTYLTLPSLVLGGLAALGFIYVRAHSDSYRFWLSRTAPSPSPG